MKKETIDVIAQHFYGNRTSTTIDIKKAGLFLRGWTSPGLAPDSDKDYLLKYVNVPGANNIVIVYDANQEKDYIENNLSEIENTFKEEGRNDFEKFRQTRLISCSIPEINFTIYTRCFACRVDDNGVFNSLETGDIEKFIEYLTA